MSQIEPAKPFAGWPLTISCTTLVYNELMALRQSYPAGAVARLNNHCCTKCTAQHHSCVAHTHAAPDELLTSANLEVPARWKVPPRSGSNLAVQNVPLDDTTSRVAGCCPKPTMLHVSSGSRKRAKLFDEMRGTVSMLCGMPSISTAHSV